MNKSALIAVLALAACGQSAETQPADASFSEEIRVAPTAAAPGETIAADAVDACFLTGAEVSSALGGAYGAGVTDDRSAPYMRTCDYSGGAYDFRVNVYWNDPAMPQPPLSATLGGNSEPVPGDSGGAIFEPPVVTGGCTLAYRNANVSYNVQILNCRGLADARERLAALPRP